jgi:hypothetical protein
MTNNWDLVYSVMGDALFSHLYKEYMIFLQTKDDSLVQIAGINIYQYLNDNFGRKAIYEGPTEDVELIRESLTEKQKYDGRSHKYNLKSDQDMYQFNKPKSQWD